MLEKYLKKITSIFLSIKKKTFLKKDYTKIKKTKRLW